MDVTLMSATGGGAFFLSISAPNMYSPDFLAATNVAGITRSRMSPLRVFNQLA
jgi:hypothetical protein